MASILEAALASANRAAARYQPESAAGLDVAEAVALGVITSHLAGEPSTADALATAASSRIATSADRLSVEQIIAWRAIEQTAGQKAIDAVAPADEADRIRRGAAVLSRIGPDALLSLRSDRTELSMHLATAAQDAMKCIAAQDPTTLDEVQCSSALGLLLDVRRLASDKRANKLLIASCIEWVGSQLLSHADAAAALRPSTDLGAGESGQGNDADAGADAACTTPKASWSHLWEAMFTAVADDRTEQQDVRSAVVRHCLVPCLSASSDSATPGPASTSAVRERCLSVAGTLLASALPNDLSTTDAPTSLPVRWDCCLDALTLVDAVLSSSSSTIELRLPRGTWDGVASCLSSPVSIVRRQALRVLGVWLQYSRGSSSTTAQALLVRRQWDALLGLLDACDGTLSANILSDMIGTINDATRSAREARVPEHPANASLRLAIEGLGLEGAPHAGVTLCMEEPNGQMSPYLGWSIVAVHRWLQSESSVLRRSIFGYDESEPDEDEGEVASDIFEEDGGGARTKTEGSVASAIAFIEHLPVELVARDVLGRLLDPILNRSFARAMSMCGIVSKAMLGSTDDVSRLAASIASIAVCSAPAAAGQPRWPDWLAQPRLPRHWSSLVHSAHPSAAIMGLIQRITACRLGCKPRDSVDLLAAAAVHLDDDSSDDASVPVAALPLIVQLVSLASRSIGAAVLRCLEREYSHIGVAALMAFAPRKAEHSVVTESPELLTSSAIALGAALGSVQWQAVCSDVVSGPTRTDMRRWLRRLILRVAGTSGLAMFLTTLPECIVLHRNLAEQVQAARSCAPGRGSVAACLAVLSHFLKSTSTLDACRYAASLLVLAYDADVFGGVAPLITVVLDLVRTIESVALDAYGDDARVVQSCELAAEILFWCDIDGPVGVDLDVLGSVHDSLTTTRSTSLLAALRPGRLPVDAHVSASAVSGLLCRCAAQRGDVSTLAVLAPDLKAVLDDHVEIIRSRGSSMNSDPSVRRSALALRLGVRLAGSQALTAALQVPSEHPGLADLPSMIAPLLLEVLPPIAHAEDASKASNRRQSRGAEFAKKSLPVFGVGLALLEAASSIIETRIQISRESALVDVMDRAAGLGHGGLIVASVRAATAAAIRCIDAVSDDGRYPIEEIVERIARIASRGVAAGTAALEACAQAMLHPGVVCQTLESAPATLDRALDALLDAARASPAPSVSDSIAQGVSRLLQHINVHDDFESPRLIAFAARSAARVSTLLHHEDIPVFALDIRRSTALRDLREALDQDPADGALDLVGRRHGGVASGARMQTLLALWRLVQSGESRCSTLLQIVAADLIGIIQEAARDARVNQPGHPSWRMTIAACQALVVIVPRLSSKAIFERIMSDLGADLLFAVELSSHQRDLLSRLVSFASLQDVHSAARILTASLRANVTGTTWRMRTVGALLARLLMHMQQRIFAGGREADEIMSLEMQTWVKHLPAELLVFLTGPGSRARDYASYVLALVVAQIGSDSSLSNAEGTRSLLAIATSADLPSSSWSEATLRLEELSEASRAAIIILRVMLRSTQEEEFTTRFHAMLRSLPASDGVGFPSLLRPDSPSAVQIVEQELEARGWPAVIEAIAAEAYYLNAPPSELPDALKPLDAPQVVRWDGLPPVVDLVDDTDAAAASAPSATHRGAASSVEVQQKIRAPWELGDGDAMRSKPSDRILRTTWGASGDSARPWLAPCRVLADSPALTQIDLRTGRRHQPIVIVASLLTKSTNLGGLSRTCEIFSAEALAVPDLRLTRDKMFKSLAMASAEWLPIVEVRQAEMQAYLASARAAGYTIVALEQTVSSVPLQSFTFPDRVMLVLGAELLGVPADVLQSVVDVCVEIPQSGVTRSLNVHVSASLALFEYTRQRLCRASPDA